MAMLSEIPLEDELVELTPKAGFVVKTKLEQPAQSPSREKGTKVFLNICHDDKVPLPEVEYKPEVVYPLIMDNKWEIPIVTSDSREDKDKKGQLAYVYDCIVNSRAMRWIQMDKELRDILVEWCLESVEMRSDLMLDRESITTPKMKSKGEIPNLKIRKSDMEFNRLNRELEGKANQLRNDPLSVIEAKRFEEEEMNDEELSNVDIFNVKQTNRPSTNPLIQEIEDMTISSKKTQRQSKRPSILERPELKYEITMVKVDVNGYKLKVEVRSQNTSSLDYDLGIDRSQNVLIVKNLNKNYITKRDLEIPIPSLFSNPSFKSFYVHRESKLIIFIK